MQKQFSISTNSASLKYTAIFGNTNSTCFGYNLQTIRGCMPVGGGIELNVEIIDIGTLYTCEVMWIDIGVGWVI